ncbi:sel1 repeat family protein [Chitinimonas arctica]|uniref:Sel1 repeat family protein n=1 Tax=Chitinimonas arctica TaxID=2594795 RepID=A0A516SA34_9NEIS|nr:sel1 repeat family protein [Chitinimonas arctica]QDQ24997.1 sel1 repeat family protein [Chitinimonas arctica]
MSESELQEHKKMAEGGAIKSARKLSFYYGYINLDDREALKWLTTAAEQGDTLSQHNLAAAYLYNQAIRDIGKAKYWATKAKSGGSVESQSLLDEISQEEKDKPPKQ